MDYIVKPANEVDLAARVRSALNLKHEIDQRKAREGDVRAQLQRALVAERALAEANTRLTEQATLLAAELRGCPGAGRLVAPPGTTTLRLRAGRPLCSDARRRRRLLRLAAAGARRAVLLARRRDGQGHGRPPC